MALIHYARHSFGIECHTTNTGLCSAAKKILLGTYGLAAALFMLALFARRAFHDLLASSDTRPIPVLLNLAGLGLLFATLPQIAGSAENGVAAWVLPTWIVALLMTITGTVLMIAPAQQWKTLFKTLGFAAPLVVIFGTMAPFLAGRIRPLWHDETLAGITLDVVTWMLRVIGSPAVTNHETKIVGAGRFFVDIAPACSGIEGIVLTTVFSLIYLGLFRRDLRFPHALLILPVALVASWLLNAVRITVLIQIGIAGYPELAVGGFHSHAGWLMFTILSLGIVVAVNSIGFFHTSEHRKSVRVAHMPFFSDPVVAQILPFAVFMASALLASTFSETSLLTYPLRALAMGIVLTLFWPYLRSLSWRVDPLAVGLGVFVAAYWIAFAPAGDDASPVAEVGAIGAGIWLIARIAGTALFVPVIEELFFRKYLMELIAPDVTNRVRVAIGVLITSGLFAALHDRWLEAGIAGVLFALIALRSRNITDAIVAHAIANALIAFWALATGNWAMV